jgi:hypothetical protein
MIHEAKNQILDHGFEVSQKLNDSHGTIGYALTFSGSNYILVAKEYAHRDLASFLATLVANMPESVDYIFYNNSTDTYTVFDGQYLSKNADRSSGQSKKRDCNWFEIPLSCGAELESFLRNEKSPEQLSGNNETLTSFT